LFANAQPHLRDVMTALLATGCRVGEILSLQWKDVRDDVILIKAEKAKTSRSRAVPITAALRAVLDARRKDPSGEDFGPDAYAFGNECGERIKRVRHASDNTCKRAGIKDLHIRDLRREQSSQLEESGAHLHEVREWLGHTNVATTSRYLKTSGQRLQRVARMFERRKIDGALTENPSVQ
jgi:integrase